MNFRLACRFMPRVGQPELTLRSRPSKLLQFREIAIFHSLQIDFSPAKNENRNCILQPDLGGRKNYTAVQKRFGRASARILLACGAIPSMILTSSRLRIFHSLQIYFAASISKEDLSANHRTIAPSRGGIA